MSWRGAAWRTARAPRKDSLATGHRSRPLAIILSPLAIWLCFRTASPVNPDSIPCGSEIYVDSKLALFGAFFGSWFSSTGTSGYSCANGSLFLPRTQPPTSPPTRHPPGIRHPRPGICDPPSGVRHLPSGDQSMDKKCGGTWWTRVVKFPGLPVPFRASLGCLILTGPSLSVPASGMASPSMFRPRPPGIGFVLRIEAPKRSHVTPLKPEG